MKKFYQKKDLAVEESPLTLQLQRRHTVVEGDKDNKVVTKLKQNVSRSNSTSSIYRSPKTAKDLSSQKRHLESTLSANSSGSSSASTVVITECQLSSSWIYNNKKAQMGSNDAATTSGSSSQQVSDNEEAKSPIIPRPKVKSASSRTNRSRRCSSCCCYGAIVILAGFAVMGIIATIGGIVYMEFFSGSNKTHNRGNYLDEDLRYMKKIGQAIDANENNTSPELKSNGDIQNQPSKPKQELEILDNFKDSSNDNAEKKPNKGSGNILRVKKAKKDTVPATKSDIPTSSHASHEQQLQENSNNKQSSRQTDLLPSNAKNNSPYSKLFELYKDIHTDISKNSSRPDESSKPEINELNIQVTDSKANEPSDSFKDSISEFSHQNEAESNKKERNLDESFDTDDSSESLKTDPELNSEKHISRSEEVSQPEIPKYFFRRPSHVDNGLDFRNLFGITEENDNSEVKPSVHGGLPQIPQLSDLNDNVSRKQDVSLNSEDFVNESFDPPNGEVSGPAIPKNQDVRFNSDSLNESFDPPRGDVSGPTIPKNQDVPFNSDSLKESFDPPSEVSGPAIPKNQDVPFNSDSSNESFEPPSGEVSGPAIPKAFFQMPAKDTGLEFRDMFDTSEKMNTNSEQSSFPRFLPHIPELSDQDDAGDNITNTQEPDLPLELNHPISEAKIAVPGPLDLIRRFTIGESDSKKDSETDQHDRRFFLAEALERLRSLDVRNILPSSRQKADYKKNLKPKVVPKVQNEQEVVTERSNYLQHLRRRFFKQFE